MKILFITSSSINGGAQKHIREMFNSLKKMGHSLFLAAPNGWLVNELSESVDNILVLSSMKKEQKKLCLFIDRIKPDVTNTFILSGAYYGTRAWKRKKYGKLFITVNNPVIYDGIGLINRFVYPLIYRSLSMYANAFLVKSETVQKEVEHIIGGKKPVLSIKNGVDFSKFNKEAVLSCELPIDKKNENDIVIVNTAVLEERKGQYELINAVCALRKKYPVQLLIVGEGSYRGTLEKLITNTGSKEYVHLLGFRKDINAILSKSNIFVLSSYHEGLPNALMEAMAMGLPCVATNVGGVRQLMPTEDMGIVIEPKNVGDMESAIERFIIDK